MHHSSSARPSWQIAKPRSRCNIASNVPSLVHASNKFHAVDHGPYSVGTSRHGAPVRNTHKMALRISRRSRGRRPVLKFPTGNKSAINSHCASVRLWRGMRVLFMPLSDHEIAV